MGTRKEQGTWAIVCNGGTLFCRIRVTSQGNGRPTAPGMRTMPGSSSFCLSCSFSSMHTPVSLSDVARYLSRSFSASGLPDCNVTHVFPADRHFFYPKQVWTSQCSSVRRLKLCNKWNPPKCSGITFSLWGHPQHSMRWALGLSWRRAWLYSHPELSDLRQSVGPLT